MTEEKNHNIVEYMFERSGNILMSSESIDEDPNNLDNDIKTRKVKIINKTKNTLDFSKIITDDKCLFQKKCKYYKNIKAKIVTECCSSVICCRHCHNKKNQHEMKLENIKLMCIKCAVVQELNKNCINEKCKVDFCKYLCVKCCLLADSTNIFHCEFCQICRIGERKDFFHCTICNTCISNKYLYNHNHIEDTLKTYCPICAEYMFTSKHPVEMLRCGHSIHSKCLERYKVFSISCPVCMKSFSDNSYIKYKLKEVRKSEYFDLKQEICKIKCFDCYNVTDSIDYVVFNTCKNCGSINTTIVDSNS